MAAPGNPGHLVSVAERVGGAGTCRVRHIRRILARDARGEIDDYDDTMDLRKILYCNYVTLGIYLFYFKHNHSKLITFLTIFYSTNKFTSSAKVGLVPL